MPNHDLSAWQDERETEQALIAAEFAMLRAEANRNAAPVMQCVCGRGENGMHADGCEWLSGNQQSV